MESNEQLKQLLKEHVKQQKTSAGISSLLQDVFREATRNMLLIKVYVAETVALLDHLQTTYS